MNASQTHGTDPAAGPAGDCAACRLNRLCLPVSLSREDVQQLKQILVMRRPLHRGAHLYYAGERLRSVFVVRAGSLKSYTITQAGEEQVHGFRFPGEMIGLDALDEGVYRGGAVALETTSVCEMHFEHLEALARRLPSLQHRLLQIMSGEIGSDHLMLQTLARCPAEERLAIVLLDLSERFARRGLSPYRFLLPMPRADLGNYLGLAPETMSRLFGRFRASGLIVDKGPEVVLKDITGLKRLAGRHVDVEAEPPPYGAAAGV